MLRSNRELWFAFVTALLVTGPMDLYLSLRGKSHPPVSYLVMGWASSVSFLMLMTETLYSMRKRVRGASWGRMSDWLQFHIFTGLVGPYMVLLHTSWKFNGLAGVTTLFTVVIVFSGLIGRYIYTRIPRTLDGLEIEGTLSQEALKQARQTDGALAYGPYSDWHGVICHCLCPYRRGVILRHPLEVGGLSCRTKIDLVVLPAQVFWPR